MPWENPNGPKKPHAKAKPKVDVKAEAKVKPPVKSDLKSKAREAGFLEPGEACEEHDPVFFWNGYKVVYAEDGELSRPVSKWAICGKCDRTYEVIDDVRVR